MRDVSAQRWAGAIEAVRKWIRQAEIDAGSRRAVSSEEFAESKAGNRENENKSAPTQF